MRKIVMLFTLLYIGMGYGAKSASAMSVAIEVPKSWRDTAAQMRIILTDKAHNRTEKVVQVS